MWATGQINQWEIAYTKWDVNKKYVQSENAKFILVNILTKFFWTGLSDKSIYFIITVNLRPIREKKHIRQTNILIDTNMKLGDKNEIKMYFFNFNF